VKELLCGVLVTLYAVAGLFFLRFWRKLKDQILGYFAFAFWVLAAQELGLGMLHEENENAVWCYLMRLLAFVLILFGILSKNRGFRDRR